MGIKLMIEVFDHAPKTLSWRELQILTLIAEDANDGTRRGWPGYDGESARSETFRRRCRCSRTQFYEVLGKLIEQGVLVTEVEGCRGQQAVYSIPPLATAVPLAGAPVRTRRKGPKRPAPDGDGGGQSVPSNGTQSDGSEGYPKGTESPSEALSEPAKSPVQRDPIANNESRSAEKCVPSNGTPTPHIPSLQNPLKTSSSANDSTSPEDDASADAPARDGLRPRGSAAPEEIDQHRMMISTMDGATVAESLRNLAGNFAELNRRALEHATRRGLAYGSDAFNRETLWFAMQEHLGHRVGVAA